MKQFTKLLGALTLSTALVTSSLAAAPDNRTTIQAAENQDSVQITDESLFHAEYVNGIYTITGFDGLYNTSSIVVPYKINGTAVRAINAPFSGKTNCHVVYLPDSIVSIGSDTFASSTVEYVKSYTTAAVDEIIKQPVAGEIESGSIENPVSETPANETGNLDETAKNPVLSDTLPASLKTIEDNAFQNSSIKSITVAGNMDKIGKYAFANTANFLDFTLAAGASIDNIDDFAFSCSQLHTITINGTVGRLGNYAVEKTANITDFTVNSTGSITTVGDHAFYNSGIHNIVLQGSVTSVGSYAFANCGNIIQVEVSSNTNYTLGEYAFSCAQIHNVYLSDGLTNIEKGTFEKCGNLEKVQLPQSVKNIGDDAFKNVPNLKEINIPPDTTIASSAFEGVGDSTKKALAASGNTNALVLLGMSVVPTSTPAPVPVAAITTPAAPASVTPAPAKVSVGKVKLTSVKKKKRKAVLTWKKVKGASGYTIYKKVVKKGTKAKKAKKIKFVKVKNVSAKTTKISIKLKKKATTSFYIRAFKKAKVNGKTKTVYGKASNVKKVKA